MIEIIRNALVKYPNSKEIWMHPVDAVKIEKTIDSTGLKLKHCLMIPVGQFILSEKPLEDVCSEYYQSIYCK